MKKAILLLTILCLTYSINAQNYKANKLKYDHQDWQFEAGDPFNPGLCTGLNLLVPGIGQMIAQEGGRGAGFLAGYAGGWILYGVGVAKATIALDEEAQGGPAYDGEGLGLMAVGLIVAIGDLIWSMVDANHVAKVNNLAWRDSQNQQGMLLHFRPEIMPLSVKGQTRTSFGIGMQIRF